ncbi:hypothetical protein [Kitasatospora aureofaciens]|uniref:hypothetical protein n=1 Tax=Kitasatospora aureofaciens TaxID=1894 RepID=UPI001C47A6BB|nr:hypothetical protein [Kitasatospora aureofaciens]MBV6700380.1 hypothetical protein [Kitasatospora aureofaciens]
MLRPVDLPTVFADDRIHGTDHGYKDTKNPDQIHAGVAWWVGACLVLTTRSHGVALVHDGTELGHAYATNFSKGAINCQHYAATVSVIGEGGEELLQYGIRTLQIPGALITTKGTKVTIRLFAADGSPVTEGTGLERICDLIARDKVPIPVNDADRGRVVYRPDLADHYATAEG